MKHHLTLSSEWFQRVADKELKAILSLDDRDFQAGDYLVLRSLGTGQWVPPGRDKNGRFTAGHWGDETMDARITHVVTSSTESKFMKQGYLLSIEILDE